MAELLVKELLFDCSQLFTYSFPVRKIFCTCHFDITSNRWHDTL